MKKLYERVELETVIFRTEDIITTSPLSFRYEEDELVIIPTPSNS